MTLQQMEYVVALDAHRNFVLAAEACGVTQPTLSAMIQKLEDELGVILFQRNRRGVVPTGIGEKVVAQARTAVKEARRLSEIVLDETGSLTGRLHIGIVPTVAPYIVPDFIFHFTEDYPEVELQIDEMKSSILYSELSKGNLDMAIATPPQQQEHDILEVPIYKERFLAYFSELCMKKCAAAPAMMPDGLLSLSLMDMDYMWILDEGHCMNTGDFSFCMDRMAGSKTDHSGRNNLYKAGSIGTLIRIVDRNGGFTIIPEMHIDFLSDVQKENVHPLAEGNTACRTISLLVRSDYVRERLLNAVADTMKKIIPDAMIAPNLKKGKIRLF